MTPRPDEPVASVPKLVQNYYYRQDTLLPPPDFYGFEENASLAYPYVMDDVNADGVEDVVLDLYCVQAEACTSFRPPLSVPGVPLLCDQSWHRLVMVNGANGSVLWEQDLDRATAFPQSLGGPARLCAYDVVYGLVHTASHGRALLLGRWTGAAQAAQLEVPGARVTGAVLLFQEELILLSSQNQKIWNLTFEGRFTFAEVVHASMGGSTPFHELDLRLENLVFPVLQEPPTRGVRLLRNDRTESALFLRGGSLRWTQVERLDHDHWVDDWQASEWARRVDIDTGQTLWEAETFVAPPVSGPATPSRFVLGSAWGGYWSYPRVCCLDVTGDGTPDLVYTTLEWAAFPNTNLGGPYEYDVRLVVFDGATGEMAFRKDLALDSPVPIVFVPEFLGDADGDGVHDILVHGFFPVRVTESATHWKDARFALAVLRGHDGTELWRIEKPRPFFVLLLGDADGDNGNDVLVYEAYPRLWDLTNVSMLPLVAYAGSSGRVIWTARTFAAPFDQIFLWYLPLRLNGLPDVDQDGVGDVPVDDPVYLPDLTPVHRWELLSGPNGIPLRRIVTVGAFSALSSCAADFTADAWDDVCVIYGDIVDFWFTALDASTPDALWSRRIQSLRNSGYVFAAPFLKFAAQVMSDGTRDSLIANLHTFVVTADGEAIGGGESPTVIVFLRPQIMALAANGSVAWALPWLWDKNLSLPVIGPSPLSAAYLRKYEPPATQAWFERVGDDTGDLAQTWAVPLGVPGAFALVFGYAVRRRRQ